MSQKKKKWFSEKYVDLLLMGEEAKRYYVIINDFNVLMFDDTLHCGRKHFYCYCSLPFCAVEILKRHIKDCLKINGKQKIKIPKTGEYVKFKNCERKIKLIFVIYAVFFKVF